MTDNMRTILQTLGRLLLEIAGEEQTADVDKAPTPEPEPVGNTDQLPSAQEPEKPKRKRQGIRPMRDYTCIVCGKVFTSNGVRVELCPHCRIRRRNGSKKFLEAFAAAKARMATSDESSQVSAAPALPDGKIRCDRMHATIPAAMCGTREECRGCSLSPKTR